MKSKSIQRMTTAALLIALGVVIPMFSPFKIQIEPASFTLASHVPIFIAMFISPSTALAVAVGTTIGFFFGGFPIVIVLRAASHLVFVALGSFYLQRRPEVTASPLRLRLFSLVIGVIHAIGEVAIVSFFYFTQGMGDGYYQGGFFTTVILLVGLGSVVHSMVDFEISWFVTKAICKKREIAEMFGSVSVENNQNAKKMQPTTGA